MLTIWIKIVFKRQKCSKNWKVGEKGGGLSMTYLRLPSPYTCQTLLVDMNEGIAQFFYKSCAF